MSETAQKPDTAANIIPMTVAELHRAGAHLFRAHAEEAEADLADALEPDMGMYQALEDAGSLIVRGAWVETDAPVWELVGYAVAFVFSSSHYRGRIFGQHDILYLAPPYRRGRLGVQLIEDVEEQARNQGATRLLMLAKPGGTLDALLPRIGFDVEETVFRKDL